MKKIYGEKSISEIHKIIFQSELDHLCEEINQVEVDIKHTRSVRKKNALCEKKNELDKKLSDLNEKSRCREYQRKAKRIAELFPEGAFYVKKGKDARNTYLTNEQAIIYAAIIALASLHGSWVNVWCGSGGIETYGSRGIVELYEYIMETIYANAGITGWGKRPYIDQWLQVLDVRLDYSMAKRVCCITDKLEQMRKDGAALNHQINYGSIVCQDGADTHYAHAPYGPVPSAVPKRVDPMDYLNFTNEEQFFAGVDELTDRYAEEILCKTKDKLVRALEIGQLMYDLKDKDNDEEIERLPEYEQQKSQMIRYVMNMNDTVTEILKEQKITVDQAIEYLKNLPS